jgi:hypothetical protein
MNPTCFGRARSLRRLSLPFFILGALALPPGLARAAVSPFVYGGASATYNEKDDTDLLLDPITIKDHRGSWEAGLGARFFSRQSLDAGGRPRWEIRPRLGWGGGNLAGVVVSVDRSNERRNRYSFTSAEEFRWRSWQASATFLVRPLPRIGLYAGPGLQSVVFRATRTWTGTIPQFCSDCGDGKDKITVRYGLLEVGAHVDPFSLPVSFETYWIPKRVDLSTTRRGQAEYKANFPKLTESFGGRLVVSY